MERLHSKLGGANAPIAIQNEIVDMVRFEDVDMLARFERFVSRRRVGEIDNAQGLLDQFAVSERRRRWLDRAAAFPFLLALAFSINLLTTPFEAWHVVVWCITVVLSLGAAYAVDHRDAEYLDPRALGKLRARA